MCAPAAIPIATGLLAGAVIKQALKPPSLPSANTQASQKLQNPTQPTDPNVANAMYRKEQNKAGIRQANTTLLTGTAGVDPSLLNIGKTSLLGGGT